MFFRPGGNLIIIRQAIGMEPFGMQQMLLWQRRRQHPHGAFRLDGGRAALLPQRQGQGVFPRGQARRVDLNPQRPPLPLGQNPGAVPQFQQQIGIQPRLNGKIIFVIRALRPGHAHRHAFHPANMHPFAQGGLRLGPEHRRSLRIFRRQLQ